MKRDMDLIRKILLQLENVASDDDINIIEIEGFSHDQIAYHIYLLHDAGLIRAHILMGFGTAAPKNYSIFGLTWAGHDFLDASRDEGRWIKAKVVINEMKGASFEIIKTVLVEIMKSQMTTILSGKTV
jgi:hypothetical protein